MVHAAAEAARTAQARSFVEEATRWARDARVSLPEEAGLAGQLAAARRFQAPVEDAAKSPATAEEIRGDFVETLAQARELFSDPNIRRMLESANAETVVARGLEAAEEAPENLEDGLTAEEIDVLLGPTSDVEILVPWVNYATILFGVAWLVATGSPEFLEYKEPLEDMLTRLGTLRAALEAFLKRRDQQGRKPEQAVADRWADEGQAGRAQGGLANAAALLCLGYAVETLVLCPGACG